MSPPRATAAARVRRLAAALGVLAVAAFAVAGCGSDDERPPAAAEDFPPPERAPAAEARERPNIVVVISDDQEAATFNRRYMPRTTKLLAEHGIDLTNFVVATPICCPSRASLITGQYPHNNGVYLNKEGWGRFRDKQNNLGTWMQEAGYRTAWIGKFLQGYDLAVKNPNRRAPGFDEWKITLKPKYFGWKLYTEQGRVKGGKRPRDYYTDVLTREAVKLIREQSRKPRPLFMVVNHLAPHKGDGGSGRCAKSVAPAPRDRGKFRDEPLPRPPSFNRVDPEKTAFPSDGEFDRDTVAKETARYRCRVESLASLDRGIAAIHRAFAAAGEADNTVIAFTSDNGMLQGQHALKGKGIPYEEGLKVPFAIRVPPRVLGGRPVSTVDALTANIDVAPTLLELADARPCVNGSCRVIDGRSLVPLMKGDDSSWPKRRAILIEGGADKSICAYRGLRLPQTTFLQAVEPTDDGCANVREPELYDLAEDPYQLHNLAPDEPARVAKLRERLSRLENCAGNAAGERVPGHPPCE